MSMDNHSIYKNNVMYVLFLIILYLLFEKSDYVQTFPNVLLLTRFRIHPCSCDGALELQKRTDFEEPHSQLCFWTKVRKIIFFLIIVCSFHLT